MIGKIAWKNIWRNPSRSLILIAAITVGIWSLIFLLAFVRGQVDSYIANTINNTTGHIVIQDMSFYQERLGSFYMPEARELVETFDADPTISGVSGRIKMSGMIASGNAVQGVLIIGLAPVEDTSVFSLRDKLKEGSFFLEEVKNPIIISKELATKLNIDIGSKAIFTSQTAGAELASAAFRVVGLYSTGNTTLDKTTAYALRQDLQKLAEIPQSGYHEVVLKLKNIENVKNIAEELQAQNPDLKVRTYGEVAPELALFESQIRINMIVMAVIFMLALIFGIINTMLMAVLERMREIGMLMAIGMNKWRVFLMIVLETIILSCISIPAGLLLGYTTVTWFYNRGIDLSAWSKGLAQFGISDLIRPQITPSLMVFVASAVVITAIIGSVYPAWKAIQLRPVEALRKL